MKMSMRAVTLSALLITLSLPLRAEVKPNESGWLCGSPADWETAVVRAAPRLILNNFFFEEGKSLMTTMKVLKVEYSAINRTSDSYRMTSQFVGLAKGGVVTFALCASPSFDTVGSGTETVKDDVYVPEPVLPRTERVCAFFAAEGKKK